MSFQPRSSTVTCVRVRCASGREKPPAGGSGRDGRAEVAERSAHDGVLDGRGCAGPRVVGDLRTTDRLVVVLDRATTRRALHELDQAEAGELAHVVADVAERRAELVGQLTGAGGALVERREDLDPQRVGQRLDDAGV